MKKSRLEIIRTIKFLAFFVLAIGLEFGSFVLFEEVFHFDHWLGHLISMIIVTVFHFIANREFTFRSNNKISIGLLKSLAYHATFTLLSTLWTEFLTMPSVGWNSYLVKGITIVLHFSSEYLYDRFVVFGHSIDSKDHHHHHGSAAQADDITPPNTDK